MTTFSVLPELGEQLTLYTHQVVREDAHSLYAFASDKERDVFRLLLRVNGVGAKMALAILSGMDAAAFSRCVYEGDTATLERLPGVGKKTAQRLVVEMRDRFEPLPGFGAPRVSGSTVEVRGQPAAEAVSALVSLGLKPQDASRRVHALDCEGLACEEIVRRALQAMGGK